MVNTFLFANNAISALASGISNVATSVTLTTGSGALFPSPTAGQQFALTFTDAATGLLNEIVYCTARTGDVLTIVRAQESTSALNWSAGDVAANLVTAASLTAFLQASSISLRTKLTGNTAFSVQASGGNYTTLALAVADLTANYDFAGFQVTLNMNAGTFAGATIPGFVGQASPLILNGAGAGSTTVNGRVIASTGTSNFLVQNYTAISSVDCIAVSAGQGIVGAGMVFGAATSAHFNANVGIIQIANNYTITGGSGAHYQMFNGGKILMAGGLTVTLTGTPAFSIAFCNNDQTGLFVGSVSPPTFSGAATGQRYFCDNLSMISTNGSGANYFPGNSAGVNNGHGAQYN